MQLTVNADSSRTPILANCRTEAMLTGWYSGCVPMGKASRGSKGGKGNDRKSLQRGVGTSYFVDECGFHCSGSWQAKVCERRVPFERIRGGEGAPSFWQRASRCEPGRIAGTRSPACFARSRSSNQYADRSFPPEGIAQPEMTVPRDAGMVRIGVTSSVNEAGQLARNSDRYSSRRHCR